MRRAWRKDTHHPQCPRGVEVLAHIEKSFPVGRGCPVLHWFTGTAAEARRAVNLGCYFSINAEMLRSPKHRALVAGLPIDRLLTETDGPFVNTGGRPMRPRDVADTVSKLAAVRTLRSDEMGRQVVANLAALIAT
jgi:TatD DNase family protein